MNLTMSLNRPAENKGIFSYRRILKAILIGIGGNLILIVFLMTFLQIFEAIKFMPWIIAFNTAHTGYSLVDRAGKQLAYRKLISALAGFANVMITIGIFAVMSVLLFGDLYLGVRDMGLFTLIGVLCSLAGTLLAAKYYQSNIK